MTYYSRKLKMPFGEVLAKVTANLQQQGFGIVTTLDMKDIFKQKLGEDFRNYKILGACNPSFAFNAISLESHVGVMLPCNIVIQEHENGEIEVSAINPLESIDKTMSTPNLVELADKVTKRLRGAIDDLRSDVSDVHVEAIPSDVKTVNMGAPMQG